MADDVRQPLLIPDAALAGTGERVQEHVWFLLDLSSRMNRTGFAGDRLRSIKARAATPPAP
jgi:hypothetical protein